MSDLLKNTAKFAIGTCVTLCAVTVAASVTVGNNLGKVIIAGFKGAQAAMKEELVTQASSNANETAESVNEYVAEFSDEVEE